MRRRKNQLQEEESGNAEGQVVHQGHIFFNHDDIDKFFDIERNGEVGQGCDDETEGPYIQCFFVGNEKYQELPVIFHLSCAGFG